eukprot:5291516-Amphidinium_carterae.1
MMWKPSSDGPQKSCANARLQQGEAEQVLKKVQNMRMMIEAEIFARIKREVADARAIRAGLSLLGLAYASSITAARKLIGVICHSGAENTILPLCLPQLTVLPAV